VNAGDGVTSLREAINSANALPGEDLIDFDPGLFGATIQLQSGNPLTISDDLMLSGLGAEELTVRGAGNSVFVVSDSNSAVAPKNVTISGLTITGGSYSHGGGIRSSENVTLIDSVVSGNFASSIGALGVADFGGAGIWASPSLDGDGVPITTTILRSQIFGNIVTLVPDLGAATPTTQGYSGGGIFSRGTLIVMDSVVSLNQAGQGSLGYSGSAAGAGGDGGGIYSLGAASISGTTISGNFAGKGGDAPTTAFARDAGDGGNGGGIAAVGSLDVANSSVSGNFAGAAGVSASGWSGNGGGGGGIHFVSESGGSLAINRTTVSGNAAGNGGFGSGVGRTSTHGGDGGGIWASGSATIEDSTVMGNAAGNGGDARSAGPIVNPPGHGGSGGGLLLTGFGSKTFVNVTASSNSAGRGGSAVAGTAAGNGGNGGGMMIGGTGAVALNFSTIANNAAGDAGTHVVGDFGGGFRGNGGGAYHAGTATTVQLNNSIVAKNLAGQAAPTVNNDLAGPGSFTARFSLIGVNTGATIVNNGGNKIGTAGLPLDPLLNPLEDNGGVTLTHSIPAGSPALNAGDPALVQGSAGTPITDQRGAPFDRIFNGRIDMGSFELEDAVTVTDPDFDNDGAVDGNDFLLWQRGTGDADNDGDSDGNDLAFWRQSFPASLLASSATVYAAAGESLEAASSRWFLTTREYAGGSDDPWDDSTGRKLVSRQLIHPSPHAARKLARPVEASGGPTFANGGAPSTKLAPAPEEIDAAFEDVSLGNLRAIF
jgi:hypothetical protein